MRIKRKDIDWLVDYSLSMGWMLFGLAFTVGFFIILWYSIINEGKMSKIQKLSEYAKEKGVSRQYIYAYFQSQIIDLPIFVEFEGQRIEVGRQKFIKIDDDK